jgi:hypothetical protein
MRRTFKTAALAAALASTSLFSSLVPFSGLTPSAYAQQTAPAAPSATATQADAPTTVPVKAVILYSSGVGYFEHAGTVKGDAATQLQFDTAQINDVLKSLVLQDKGGSVGTVTYASQNPLDKTLKSFAVDITANPSLDQLLNQLRGAKVALTLAGEQVSGIILGVEHRIKPAGENKTVDVPVLNLVNGANIRAIELQDVRDIKLDDAVLQAELAKALVAVAAARDKDKKPVTVHFKGEGEREVVLGYVVEAPVWKTSYRLVLGDPPKGKDDKSDGKLQGWAIVENQTDNDWNDVQLSLVSGRPISFIEDLYAPLYLPRPVVLPDLFASLKPRVYAEGNSVMMENEAAQMGQVQSMRAAGGAGFGGGGGGGGRRGGRGGAPGAAPMIANGNLTYDIAGSESNLNKFDPTLSVLSGASASQLGELFQYTVGSVSLARQSSAMIPIVTDSIQVERVSIFNPAVLPHNPLNGARLKNTTGKHLLSGPVTVLEGSTYAGDAQIDNTPPGQDRLISYGIDLQMNVQTGNEDTSTELLTGKIVKGVLYLSHKYISTVNYDATNKSDHDKSLIIEQPIQGGWDLIDTPKPAEKTDTIYRFQETVPSGKNVKLTVKQQNIHDEEVVILNTDIDSVITISKGSAIPQAVKDALLKAADLKRAVVEVSTQRDEDKANQAAIVEDQKRINETLRTIPRTVDLYNRLLGKLNDQETQLEKLREDEKAQTQKVFDRQKDLTDYLASLNLG